MQAHVREIGDTLAEIFARADAQGRSTSVVADEVAQARFKRWRMCAASRRLSSARPERVAVLRGWIVLFGAAPPSPVARQSAGARPSSSIDWSHRGGSLLGHVEIRAAAPTWACCAAIQARLLSQHRHKTRHSRGRHRTPLRNWRSAHGAWPRLASTCARRGTTPARWADPGWQQPKSYFHPRNNLSTSWLRTRHRRR